MEYNEPTPRAAIRAIQRCESTTINPALLRRRQEAKWTCPRCGRILPRREFFIIVHTNRRSKYCKECYRRPTE